MQCHTSATAVAVAASLVAPLAYPQDSLDAVVVTATRYPTRASRVLADVTVIERPEIERNAASGLVDLLSRQPGLQVVQNGSLGSSSSIFIRGTNSTQSVLLIDGVRVGSATLGQPTLDAIPLAQVERIEILRGPASALYGADAIGGVIQIFTRRGRGAPAVNAYAGVGTQYSAEVDLGVTGTNGGLSYSLGGGYFRTDGFSSTNSATTQPFSFNPDRDGFKNANFAGSVRYAFNDDNQIGANILWSDAKNQNDNGPSSFDARLEKTVGAYSAFTQNRLLPAWTSTLRIGRGVDDITNIPSSSSRSFFRTYQDQFTWQNDIALPFGRALAAYETRREQVASTANFPVDSRTIESFLVGLVAGEGGHQLQLNGRLDDNSQFGDKTTGLAAYGYQFTPEIRAYASYGTAFRAPSFNDLYFPGFSNPNLKPETAANFEVGATWEPSQQRFGAVYYDNKVENLIVASGPAFIPQNVAKADLTGVTLTYAGSVEAFALGASADFLRARDADTGKWLPRRSNRTGTLRALYQGATWQPGVEVVLSGDRYDDLANTRQLSGYSIFNATLKYILDRSWSIELRANNIFDRQYETARGFPMPGANAFIGVRYQPQ